MSAPTEELPACTPGHHTPLPEGVVLAEAAEFGDNHDRNCLSIYATDSIAGERDQAIHICDWPAFKAVGDKHQAERGGRI